MTTINRAANPLRADAGFTIGKVMRALLACLLLWAPLGAFAQSANFTNNNPTVVNTGESAFVELRTLNGGGSPSGGGLLSWDLGSCSALTFSSPPPSSPDDSGFTTVFLDAMATGTCFLTASWDPDFTGPMPVVFAPALQISVVEPSLFNIEFTEKFGSVFVDVGNTVDAEVLTTVKGSPTTGGTISWDLASCPHAQFASPPPTSTDANGRATATLLGVSDGFCQLNAFWDEDDNGQTFPQVTNPPLDVFVFGGPVSTEIVSGPAPIIPVTENPEFTVRAVQDSQPLAGAFVRWTVSVNGSKPFVFGSLCSGQYVTDSTGQASFDFDSVELSRNIGDYVVTGQANTPNQCREQEGKSGGATRGLQPPPPVQFLFGIEEVTVQFDNPPPEIQVGVLTQFDLLVQTTPSGVPVAGLDFDWFAKSGNTTPESGVTPPSDAQGRTSFSLTATEPSPFGFIGVDDRADLDIFTYANFTAFALGLEVVGPPPSQTFTDEVGAGVTVFAFKDFGSGGGKRGGSKGSFVEPVGGVPVTFTISSGNGTFTENNSTVFVAVTAEGTPRSVQGQLNPGEALGSPVLVGRTSSPVTVNITSPGFTPTSAVYTTTPSTYSIQAISPTMVTMNAGESTQLVAQVLRGSISVPSPIGAGETVTWSVTAPANGASVTPTTMTDGSSNATATFTPQVPGTYQVVGQFDPGISGVSPDTVNFSIQVDGPTVVRSLVPFSGDLTQGPAGFQFPISVRYLEDGSPVVPNPPVTVLWQVVSGDATVSPTSSQAGAPLGIAGTTVTFGSTPGPVIVSATLQEFQNVNTFFYLDLVENIVLEITDPVSQRIDLAPGADFGISLRLREESGVGIGNALISISGTVDGIPDELVTLGDGTGSISGSAPTTAGSYSIQFRYDGQGAVDSQSKAVGTPPLSETVIVNVIEEQVGIARLIDTEGNGQRGLVNTPAAPLRVLYTENDQPVQGIPINWTVNSGGGTPTSQTTNTNAQGIATFNYTFGPDPGPVSITAMTGEVSTIFTLTGELAQLRIVSGNGQSGPIQTTADQPLVVELLDPAGAGIANRTIEWTIGSGSATFVAGGTTTQVTTDANGRAQVGIRFGSSPGAISISASSDLASVPVVFAAQAQLPGLRLISGDNQSGEPGSTLPQDLVVSIAPELSKALGGVTINWEVIAGGGSVSSSTTTTDSNGQSRNQLTLGSQPGTHQVRASVTGGTGVVFTAEAVASQVVVSVVKVSGDNQSELPTNQDSAPLVVRVTRVSDGTPFAGATIVWNGNNAGFPVEGSPTLLSETTSLTNGSGEARIVARVIASGPATVTARLQDSIIDPLVFSLQGLIANTATLNQNEVRVAEVLDSACIGLASLPNPTPAQQDLLDRCRELQRGSGPSPEEVSDALDELDPDVGLTMTTAGLEVITQQITNVNNYLIEARNNPGGRGQFNIALASQDGVLPLSFLPSALIAANAEEESAEGQDLGPDFGRWGFFASGTIGRGKYREGQRIPDYDYDAGNLTAGVDYRLSDSVILGAAFGFSRHDTELREDRGTLDATGYNLIGFATWYNERQWFVDGVLSVGRNDYDLVRNINYTITSSTGGVTNISQVASSSTRGDQLGFSLAVGRDWQKGPWSLNSYLRANYLRTDFDAYEEQTIANLPGSGLALGVAARSLTNTSSVLGGKATYVLSRDWGILMPHAQIEWEHSFEEDPTQLVTRFLADPTNTSFVQLGDDLDSDFFNVGVGLSALWPGGRSAYLAYERLVSSSRLSQDTISLGIRVEF